MANESRIEPIREDWVLGFIVLDSRETNGRSQAAVGRTQMSQTGQKNQPRVQLDGGPPSPCPSPPGEGMSFPRAGKSQTRVSRPAVLARFSLPMNPPLERDRSPVAAAPTACSCRNPPQVADCIRTRCAPGRRALRTPAGSGAQGAIKVRVVLTWVRGKGWGRASAQTRVQGSVHGLPEEPPFLCHPYNDRTRITSPRRMASRLAAS